jgi:hypothetical protein
MVPQEQANSVGLSATVTIPELQQSKTAVLNTLAEKGLQELPLKQSWGKTTVTLEPVGIAGLITAWNANALFICLKLASAIAAWERSTQNHSEQVWIEKLRAASAQRKERRPWRLKLVGAVVLFSIGLATAAHLLHFGLLK